MARLYAALFGVIAVLCVGVSPAQAAAPSVGPVQALRKQFKVGHGLLVSEVEKITYKGIKATGMAMTKGRIGFSASRSIDYDLTTTFTPSPELLEQLGVDPSEDKADSHRLRAIKVGKYTYVAPFEWGKRPEGKPWTRFGGKDSADWQEYGQRGSQLVDVLYPKRLTYVLSKATQVRPGEYRGTLWTQRLYAELGPMNPHRRKVSFRLFLNKNGLPVRLITEYDEKDSLPTPDGESIKVVRHEVVDTRYYHWGARVKVSAPPPGKVVDWKDLPGPFAQDE